MRHAEPDVVIVGAGIAGGALGTVLARAGSRWRCWNAKTAIPTECAASSWRPGV